MIDARNRHFIDLINKKNYYTQKKMEEDRAREYHSQQREERKAALASARLKAIEINVKRKEGILQDNYFSKDAQEKHEQQEIEKRKVQRLQAMISK